ncbi:MAG: alpha/beta hydrolase [Paludibacter sp.]|nr:alpha/beta hydrolase [Paludibacter sp.]
MVEIKRLILSVIAIVMVITCFAFPQDTTYTTFSTLQKLKKHYPFIRIAEEQKDENIKAFENVVYKSVSAERNLHVDIYTPSKKGAYPVLFLVHGGGWRSGNKILERPMSQRIAKAGFVTVAIEYRLSLETKYPAAVHDIKAAIRWFKMHALQYSADSSRVAISGESAGGQLSMLVSMTNFDPEFEGERTAGECYANVKAAIDVDGVVSFLAPNSLNLKRKPNSADVFWLDGTFEEKPLRWKEASAIFHVDKNSVPVLFICSSVPRFHAGRDEMIDMYNQLGLYHESYTIPDTPHSFWLFDPWFEPTADYIQKFLIKVL